MECAFVYGFITLLFDFCVANIMPETICRKCGSDLQLGDSTCPLCELEETLVCPECGYTTDKKIHTDCLTAMSLVC